jgi:isocitrate dehydrogenase
LRWDSLGEFLALAVSLDHLGRAFNNQGAVILGEALDKATAEFLQNDKSPSRKVNELDNRGSHYWLALYWAEAMTHQSADPALAEKFSGVAKALKENQEQILQELIDAQGKPVDIGGYYSPEIDLVNKAMRASKTLNSVLAEM